ncbi:MAG: hypothetical protein JWO67_610 [Streptosporangiaceae bacterium]|jgi:hypothetical protein|nr:hypothetical protein [Streptosporangiaceae bacterium]
MGGKSIYLRDRPAFTGGSPQAVYEELWARGRKERLRLRVILAVGALALGGWLVSVWFGVALALAVAAADLLHHWWKRTSAGLWRRGLSGDQRMSRLLRFTLERRGYRVLHARAVPGHGKVDHLVIGPSGVWLIDNQAWHPDTEIEAYGGKLYIDGKSGRLTTDKLHNQARTVAELLSERLEIDVAATPVVAVHGGRLRRRLTANGVSLLRAIQVPGLIRGRQVAQYSREQIDLITRTATHVLPIGTRGLTA